MSTYLSPAAVAHHPFTREFVGRAIQPVSVVRWMTAGAYGAKLRHFRNHGRRYTTEGWLREFFDDACNRPQRPRRKRKPAKQVAFATVRERLAREGLI